MGVHSNPHQLTRQVRIPIALIEFGTSRSIWQVCRTIARTKTVHFTEQEYGQKISISNDQIIEIELQEGIGTVFGPLDPHPGLFESLVNDLLAVPNVEIIEKFLYK